MLPDRDRFPRAGRRDRQVFHQEAARALVLALALIAPGLLGGCASATGVVLTVKTDPPGARVTVQTLGRESGREGARPYRGDEIPMGISPCEIAIDVEEPGPVGLRKADRIVLRATLKGHSEARRTISVVGAPDEVTLFLIPE